MITVLFITEGKNPEEAVIRRLLACYGIAHDADISVVNTNIYPLYEKMCREQFMCDVKDILRTMPTMSEENKEKLSKEYTFTYLIFDCDAQHLKRTEDNQSVSCDTVKKNMSRLQEMVKFCDNETDPTKGKLYLNYPMIESYRDCDEFFDPTYKDASVKVANLAKYKELVGRHKHASLDIKNYHKKDFNALCAMNLCKANHLLYNDWSLPALSVYRRDITQTAIVLGQTRFLENNEAISVLNTLLFWAIDYYGNKCTFYKDIELSVRD